MYTLQLRSNRPKTIVFPHAPHPRTPLWLCEHQNSFHQLQHRLWREIHPHSIGLNAARYRLAVLRWPIPVRQFARHSDQQQRVWQSGEFLSQKFWTVYILIFLVMPDSLLPLWESLLGMTQTHFNVHKLLDYKSCSLPFWRKNLPFQSLLISKKNPGTKIRDPNKGELLD